MQGVCVFFTQAELDGFRAVPVARAAGNGKCASAKGERGETVAVGGEVGERLRLLAMEPLFQEDGFVTESAPVTEICASIGIMRQQMTIWLNRTMRVAEGDAGAGGWR